MLIGKSTEDYLEAIYNSLRVRGEAKTNQIADDLGIKAPSVTEMFQKLDTQGLINYRKYGGVTLTEKGVKIAKGVRESHEAIREFFKLLQVSEELADEDACKVEHNLSVETNTQLQKFIQFLKECPKGEPDWVKHFKKYSVTGKFPGECERNK